MKLALDCWELVESDTHFPKDDSRHELLALAIVVFAGYALLAWKLDRMPTK
jgi:hypothetical protein